MQITQRIPLDQFSYIEFTEEYDSPEEAIQHNKELIETYADPGLPNHEWVKVRRRMFNTGEFDPNEEGLSKAQRYFVNQCKLALRDTSA